MLSFFKNRSAIRHKAEEFYGAVVAQARQPDFYARLGVQDTPEGRFELVALHLFLVAERLRAEGPASEELNRQVIETFVMDMDDCMREMGVGDLTVPKKVKRAAANFYARAGIYRSALAQSTDALLHNSIAEIYGLQDRPGDVAELARYIRNETANLSNWSSDDPLRFSDTSNV